MNENILRQLVDPDYIVEHGFAHELAAQLRKENPVAYVENPGGTAKPFWAITRHEHIKAISTRPDIWINKPRLFVNPLGIEGDHYGVRNILMIDPPDHRLFRELVQPAFLPRSLARMRAKIQAYADQAIKNLIMVAEGGREFDFNNEYARLTPSNTINNMLGIPEKMQDRMYKIQETFALAADPEFITEETSALTQIKMAEEQARLFDELYAERKRSPQDDLITLLLQNNTAEDRKVTLSDAEIMTFCSVMFAGGVDTVRNTTNGILISLLEQPDILHQLKKNPELMPTAVGELLRWISPLYHFCRTAALDTEIEGTSIKAGESVALFYASANRDESVFENADRLILNRQINPHLAFGIGDHFCLGHQLARMQLTEILPRLVNVLNGGEIIRVDRGRIGNVEILKRLNVRLDLKGFSNQASTGNSRAGMAINLSS